MRLAIVGLQESFYFLLRPYIEREGVEIASVFGGVGHDDQAAQLAAELRVDAAGSVEEVIGLGCDAALVGGAYADRPEWIIALLAAGIPVFATKVLAADYPRSVDVIEAVGVFQAAIRRGRLPVPLDEYRETAAALHMARISTDERRTVDRSEIE